MPECLKCKGSFPNHVLIDGKKRNLKNRKFCTTCSPFGKHNTINIIQKEIKDQNPNRFCPMCKINKSKKHFYTRRIKDVSSYCKECVRKNTIIRQNNFKEFCVKHKGNKCCICGYKKCLAALEFHHKDPNEKDINITKMRHRTISKKLFEELDKCILVCANCHREIHYSHTIKKQ